MSIKLTLPRYEAALTLREQMLQVYPQCFFPIGLEKPLKIGIFEDLLGIIESAPITPTPAEEELQSFLHLYSSTPYYRAALIRTESVRIDLEGVEVEPVSEDDRLTAKTRFLMSSWELTPEEIVIIRERKAAVEKAKQARIKAEVTHQQEAANQKANNEKNANAKAIKPAEVTELNGSGHSTPSRGAAQATLLNINATKPKLTLKKSNG